MENDVLEFSDVLDIKAEDNGEFFGTEEFIIPVNDDDEQQVDGGSEIVKEEICLDDYEEAEEVLECVCRRCNATFKTINSLEEHLKICRVTPLKCKHCSKIFFGLGNLRAHMKQHSNINSLNRQEFTYPLSKKLFKSTIVQSPVRVVECLFDCDLCDKKFRSLEVLRQHRRIHVNAISNTSNETKESRKYKTRARWTLDDEELLVELWSQRIDEFHHRQNKQIYEEISLRYDSRPRQYTPQEIKQKIRKFTNKYKDEKKDFDDSGFQSHWGLFSKIDAFMSETKLKNFELSTEDSIFEDDQSFSGFSQSIGSNNRTSFSSSPSQVYAADIADASIKCSSPSPKDEPSTSRAAKRRKSSDVNEMEALIELIKGTDKTIKTELDDIKKSDDKFLKIEMERNEIFKKHVANMGKLSEEIINLLKNKHVS